MRDFTAGHIGNEEGKQLIAALQQALAGPAPKLDDSSASSGVLEFHAGVSYRNILVYRAGNAPAPFAYNTKTQPPHDIPDKPIAAHLPQGPGAALLRHLMEAQPGGPG